MTRSRSRIFLLVLIFLAFPFSAGADREETDQMTEEMQKYRFETVTTKEGLKFSIPSDMPIERKDGLVKPIPFEEYLYIKFKMIEERIGKMEKRLDAMEGKLLSKIDEVKVLQLGAAKKNEPAAQPQPAS